MNLEENINKAGPMTKNITQWDGCYESRWKHFLSDSSMQHPAKFSKALIERIYDHLLGIGALHRGSIVGDCFGGVAGGALVAAYGGLHWVGVELEHKFCNLALENIEAHADNWCCCEPNKIALSEMRSRIRARILESEKIEGSNPRVLQPQMPGIALEGTATIRGATSQTQSESSMALSQSRGKKSKEPEKYCPICGKLNVHIPIILQGDSRKFHEIIGPAVNAIITSPPYADSVNSSKSGIDWTKAKRPERWLHGQNRLAVQASADHAMKYGETEGQVGALPSGDISAIISSPPFTQGYKGGGGINKNGYGSDGADKVGDRSYQGTGGDRQSDNVESLKAGSIEAVVASPPYGETLNHGGGPYTRQDIQGEGQIGKAGEETYWEACRKIYNSCFLALRPGGWMVLVVKDYCQGGKRIRLCDDTARLLEHCGFQEVERIHAMLVSETHSEDMFAGPVVKKKERKSFFRRLYEAKIPEGDDRRIDYEEVFIFRKP